MLRLILLFALDTIRIAAQRAMYGGLIITKLSCASLSTESKNRSESNFLALDSYLYQDTEKQSRGNIQQTSTLALRI